MHPAECTGSMTVKRLVLSCCILLGAFASIGCPPKPVPSGTGTPGAQSPDKPKPAIKLTPAQQASLDACVDRMQDIAGALMMYYHDHRSLPERLEDLQTLPIIGADLQFSCPATGKHFIYVPNGLKSLGRPKRVLAYDPDPSDLTPDGIRWCVLAPPFNPGQPTQTIEAYPMSTREFVSYLPVIEDR